MYNVKWRGSLVKLDNKYSGEFLLGLIKSNNITNCVDFPTY